MAKIARFHKKDCPGSKCECPYRLDYRPQGMRGPRQRLEFRTKKEAEKFLTETAHKVSHGAYIEARKIPVFGAVADEWLRSKTKHHPATLQGYRSDVRHLKPLHHQRLDLIDVAAITKLRNDLQDKDGLGPKTTSAILTTCTAIFKLAISFGYTKSNPASLVDRPRKAVKELTNDSSENDGKAGIRKVRLDEVLSASEIAMLLAHAEPGLYRTLFATVAATGLRPEEAYALTWGDVQFEDARIFVKRSLSMARGADETGRIRPKFFPPKTESGDRVLSIPLVLVANLKAWKLQCPISEYDLVFCRADGAPLHRKNVLHYGLDPALRRAGLRKVTMKTLRHSHASGLIAAGAPITEVQHRLGHSNPAITLKVYTHWFKDADTGAADRYAQRFLGNPAGLESGQKVGTDLVSSNAVNSGDTKKSA